MRAQRLHPQGISRRNGHGVGDRDAAAHRICRRTWRQAVERQKIDGALCAARPRRVAPGGIAGSVSIADSMAVPGDYSAAARAHFSTSRRSWSESMMASPVAGIVVLGLIGEAIMLLDQERRDVLKCARAATAPNKVLVAGTASGVGDRGRCGSPNMQRNSATTWPWCGRRTFTRSKCSPRIFWAFYRTGRPLASAGDHLQTFLVVTGYDIPAELVIALAEHLQPDRHQGNPSGDVEKVRKMVSRARGTSSAARWKERKLLKQ